MHQNWIIYLLVAVVAVTLLCSNKTSENFRGCPNNRKGCPCDRKCPFANNCPHCRNCPYRQSKRRNCPSCLYQN